MKNRKEIIAEELRSAIEKHREQETKERPFLMWAGAVFASLDVDTVAGNIDAALSQESDGVALIADERERQIVEEGYSATNDDYYDKGQLAMAATSYVWPHEERPTFWPWDFDSWKPTPDDRIRELVKAGALIAAEIDRLKRIENNKKDEKDR